MSIQVQTIVTKVQQLLQDATGVRWTVNELVGWINSGAREIVLHKPNASVVNTVCALNSAGGTKHTIPASGLMLLDVVRNMGNYTGTPGDSTLPGRAITGISRTVLDATIPDWHSSSPSPEVKHFCADPRDPKTFYVYPPQPSNTKAQVEVVMSVVPATVAQLTDYVVLDELYESPLVDYVMYRAFSKDAEFASNRERANSHYQAFMGALTGKTQAEAGFAPKVQFTPATKGA